MEGEGERETLEEDGKSGLSAPGLGIEEGGGVEREGGGPEEMLWVDCERDKGEKREREERRG